MQKKRRSPFGPECLPSLSFSFWGCGGQSVFAECCPTFRKRSQAFAAILIPSRPFATVFKPVPLGSFTRRFIFGGFTCHVRGMGGTSWHVNMFGDMSEMIFRGRHETVSTFSDNALHLVWEAQPFGRIQFHFLCQTCVFFSKIALAELVEECKLHARVALFDMCCNLGAASQYLCGKLQNLRLGRSYCPKSLKKITKPELFQVVEGLPGNVRFQAPTYNTLTLWFPKGFAISTREKKKMKLFQMYPNAKIGQNVRETICSSVLTCLILTFWF